MFPRFPDKTSDSNDHNNTGQYKCPDIRFSGLCFDDVIGRYHPVSRKIPDESIPMYDSIVLYGDNTRHD